MSLTSPSVCSVLWQYVSFTIYNSFCHSFCGLSSLWASNHSLLAHICWSCDLYSTYNQWLLLCVCLTDNTGGAGKLFPDTGGLGVGVPASPQRPRHASALPCSPGYGHRGRELRWAIKLLLQKIPQNVNYMYKHHTLHRACMITYSLLTINVWFYVSCMHRWWEAAPSSSPCQHSAFIRTTS